MTSIAGLLATLADNTVDEIVVANGTYHVSPSSNQAADSLWIGARYQNRTRPITVRAETIGGVTFDGGGAAYFGGISFENNVHDMTWDGFTFAHGTPTSTGVVVFGGYTDQPGAPYNITMRHITMGSTITGAVPQDHAFYISATPTVGPHDLLSPHITVNGAGGIMSAFNFGHSWGANAWNVTVNRLNASNCNTSIVVWEGVLHDLLFENIAISGSARFGVRYENASDTNVLFQNVTSTGSGTQGFYSSLGVPPPGVRFSGDSWH